MEDSAGDNKVRTVDSFKKVVINVATYLLLLGICLGSTFSVLAILGSRSNGLCKLPNVPRHGSYIVVDDLEATPEELLRSAHLKYSCAPNYDLIGVKDVFCTNGNWSAKYPFCLHKKRTCLLPPYPAHGTYEGFEMGDVVPGQATVGAALIIKCNPGYGTHGTRSMVCFNGKWSGNIPDCVKLCYLDEDPSVEYHCVCPDSMPHNYQCKCNRYEPHGTIVKPRCSKNYVYFKELYDMRCVNGKWNYVAHCRPGSPAPRAMQTTGVSDFCFASEF